MAGYAREPRAYELMAILLPELADEDLTAALDRVSAYITAQDGAIKEILQDSPWGRRRLAYTIRFNGTDYRDGYYAIWHFDLVPSRMGDVERELKLDTRVIRYLVVHDDPKWGSPNDGNQPAGEAPAEEAAPAESTPAAPATSAPAAETSAAAEPAATTAASTADETVATTDEAVAITDEVVGTIGEPVEAPAEPEAAPGSASVAGATGEEITDVVDQPTNAAVTEPVEADSPAEQATDETAVPAEQATDETKQ